jgi:hypothetical protein
MPEKAVSAAAASNIEGTKPPAKKKKKKSTRQKKASKATKTTAAAAAADRRVRFNIGGTKYEVSRSVIDQRPHSNLAKICSDTWDKAPKKKKDFEIYIERNGERFQYVLDYLRDGSVQLPLSIPRGQLVMDLEYYGIDYADESITLSVADPKDLFHSLERYQEYFATREQTVETNFKAAVAQKVAFAVAREFFGVVCTGKPEQNPTCPTRSSKNCFEARPIWLSFPQLSGVSLTSDDLQPISRPWGFTLLVAFTLATHPGPRPLR